MSQNAHKKLIERLFKDVLNRNNPSAINEIIFENYFENDLMDGQTQGRKGVKERLAVLLKAFPDAEYKLQDIITDEQKAAARWIMTATHMGEFMNIPVTGKRIVLKGIDIYQIENNLITSHWNEVDLQGLLNQIRNQRNQK